MPHLNLDAGRRRIDRIIVHCSATAAGKDFTVEQIRAWHKARGFADIGYHFVVYRNGEIHTGRNLSIAGAHCKGQNSHSVGVCYIGGLASDGRTPADTRTPEQRAALLRLLRELKSRYPHASIHGHREYAAKACPCFDARNEYASL